MCILRSLQAGGAPRAQGWITPNRGDKGRRICASLTILGLTLAGPVELAAKYGGFDDPASARAGITASRLDFGPPLQETAGSILALQSGYIRFGAWQGPGCAITEAPALDGAIRAVAARQLPRQEVLLAPPYLSAALRGAADAADAADAEGTIANGTRETDEKNGRQLGAEESPVPVVVALGAYQRQVDFVGRVSTGPAPTLADTGFETGKTADLTRVPGSPEAVETGGTAEPASPSAVATRPPEESPATAAPTDARLGEKAGISVPPSPMPRPDPVPEPAVPEPSSAPLSSAALAPAREAGTAEANQADTIEEAELSDVPVDGAKEVPFQVAALDEGELSGHRGGFVLPNGMVLNIGMTVTTLLNGTQQFSMNLATNGNLITHSVDGFNQQAGLSGNAAATAILNVINSGTGNVVTDSFQRANGIVNVVQNSLNNVTIQQMTAITVDVLNASVIQKTNLVNDLTTMQILSLR
ncbi:MAG: hypothetical protein RKE52_16765 [Marinovum algicola]|uniref:hypothetical protein n=1 Tax=Marinovum algicola TaxID=42444 RepID=UPI0032EE38A5